MRYNKKRKNAMKVISIIIFLLTGILVGKEYIDESIHFFIMIPTHNNASRCIENIQSVIMQAYPHWTACIVDDASDDDTYEILKNFINTEGLSEKIILIRKELQSFALHNIYEAVHAFSKFNEESYKIIRKRFPYIKFIKQ
jgi:glycosyltransferase involved in cell wall biosynthesis